MMINKFKDALFKNKESIPNKTLHKNTFSERPLIRPATPQIYSDSNSR